MGFGIGQRGTRTATTRDGVGVSGGGGVPSPNKKRWSILMPIFIAFVVIAEIAFLGRLDMAEKVDMVHSWTNSFYSSPSTVSSVSNSPARKIDLVLPTQEEASTSSTHDVSKNCKEGLDSSASTVSTSSCSPARGTALVLPTQEEISTSSTQDGTENCEEWLEREDAVTYSRDFRTEPIWVSGSDQEWKTCAVGCKFGFDHQLEKKPDATFGLFQEARTASVLRSMESSQYYAENSIDQARRWPKTEKALAAAFISNCAARNFRLQALEALEKSNIKIDSYGGCHRNRDGRVDKVETLKHYKFSLAFENSGEEDYVTEKFFQSLVAGSVPVVVGAPNIQEFAPSPGSVLHIKELNDVPSVAMKMKYLAENAYAYNQSLRWKYEGPSDSFKALVDMAAVHSSCRLCIHLATKIWESEEKNQKRPCKCIRGTETVYHIYVRERGRFEMDSIFMRSSNLTLVALESAVLTKFKSVNHIPIWKEERPESIRGGDELKIYRIYPVGLTQRQALYTFKFNGDADLRNYVESNLCAKFEVIFV
ncbi:glycoprotein 3-alpha-L-fucosyltransferase A-like isoform X2 [Macadamia integrifolia]|uniref:glycoprotein 3-alpha-L-fucosyltransferase A-like isoform X2 n=1 Tax=Macadamia integrifolia TaxID=60698 RepID=UPI001C53093C|nr:glycoprotein 3-alpha-L-fucosyltransferase A-like isoform X2 [Macadamia integrifolia]